MTRNVYSTRMLHERQPEGSKEDDRGKQSGSSIFDTWIEATQTKKF